MYTQIDNLPLHRLAKKKGDNEFCCLEEEDDTKIYFGYSQESLQPDSAEGPTSGMQANLLSGVSMHATIEQRVSSIACKHMSRH